jgi:hypothetical protein
VAIQPVTEVIERVFIHFSCSPRTTLAVAGLWCD